MAKIRLLCLILAGIFLIQAMAGDSDRSEPNPAEVKPTDHSVSVAPKPSVTESNEEGSQAAEAPEIRRMGKHHGDKSVAGGGVIIGGLVTAIFAAVFCYIRVTRKKNGVETIH